MAGHNFSNQEISRMLKEIQAAYVVKNEDRFRILAYERAAASIEHATSDIKDYWDEGKLDEIPGVGKSLAGYLDELFKTGKVKHFESVKKNLPKAMFIFMDIPGVGPKTAFSLSKNLKIESEKDAVVKLAKFAQQGKIREIEGFGEKSENEIIQGINALKNKERKTVRMLLPYADNLAKEIITYLKTSTFVQDADPLGSLRRMVSTIGDIDISICSDNPKEVVKHILKYPKIKEVLGAGEESLVRVVLKSGQQVDLRISLSNNYGSMLQYFTGSKLHNISLREFAIKKGMSLSEYGIKDRRTGSRDQETRNSQFDNEKDFYNEIGLEWIPPELREGNEEIKLARENKLPKLVEGTDIKGDLHTHSDFNIEPSHDLGESSIEEMIERASTFKYEYLGFSEHNPSVSNHNEKQIYDLIEKKKLYLEKYSKIAKEKGINLLNGLEVDIKPSGELAVSDEAMELLDYAVVSVHSEFNLSKPEMTKRILSGLNHKKAKILGHPTGRLLNRREGYEVDWKEIFEFCVNNNKFVEISAYPDRLDLPDFLVKQAVSLGVKLIINTDAHCASDLLLIKYGVSVARRGWAQKKDIANCLSYKDLSDIII